MQDNTDLDRRYLDLKVKKMYGQELTFFFFFFLKYKHIYLFIYLFLFMAVLGLRFCARAFSICGKWGPLLIAVHGPLTIDRGLSRYGAQAPDAQAQ